MPLLPLAAALLRSLFLLRSVLLLENAAFKDVVIKAVVAFYTQYTGDQTKDRIANAVGLQINNDRDQITRQRKRLAARLGRIDKTMRNLLDNITKVNRDLVDQRLEELPREQERLEGQIDSPEHLVLSEAEVRDLVAETARFVASLGPSLREGPPEHPQSPCSV